MKKAIVTLNIGNYSSEITKLTYPFIQKYADKINTDLKIISKRIFSDYPIYYKRLQICEFGAKMKN
jgi:hypothetical protein